MTRLRNVFIRALSLIGDKKPANQLLSEACKMLHEKQRFAYVLDEVRCALNAGADVNIKDQHGYTPLDRALSSNATELVMMLYQKGADVSTHEWTPLMCAIWKGEDDLLSRAIKESANINSFDKDGFTALHHVVLAYRHNAIIGLLDHGVDVNGRKEDRNPTPLILAAEIGDAESVRVLLGRGADVKAKRRYGHDALGGACDAQHEDIMRLLLDAGAPVDSDNAQGWTPLMVASSRGDTPTVQFLIERGACVRVTSGFNNGNETALTLASKHGHHDTIAVLLANGADPNEKNTITLLQEAALQERQEGRRSRVDKGWR
ncbi:MAG: ankyrin repeat domain-containing protein [Candidatus Omnitrophota bacterium]